MNHGTDDFLAEILYLAPRFTEDKQHGCFIDIYIRFYDINT